MSAPRFRRAVLVAIAATFAFAVPAAAHPFVAGGNLPVDSLATMTLTMAHGCGGDDGGDGEPTTEVALEVPDWLRIVEAAETPGYSSAFETAADGAVEVVVWTADGAGEPAPAFDLQVVASGPEGEERHLAVFQGCENGSYRWVGTADEPADDPAVNVTLAAADPDSPPPDEDRAATEPAEEPDPAPETTAEPETTGEPEATEDPDPVATATDEAEDEDEPAAADGTAEGSSDGGGATAAVVAALLVVLIGAFTVSCRRTGGKDET